MLRRLLIVCSVIVLTACGFHLRGSQGSVPLSFTTLAIVGDTKSTIARNLTDIMRGQVNIAPAATAQVIAEVGEITHHKIVLTKDSQGRASEYRLYANVTMQAYANNKDQLISPTRLSVTRTLSTGNGYDTGIDLEESRLYADMDAQLANQLQYRLRAIKLK
jgi:LPS-assembly lipoprotein